MIKVQIQKKRLSQTEYEQNYLTFTMLDLVKSERLPYVFSARKEKSKILDNVFVS